MVGALADRAAQLMREDQEEQGLITLLGLYLLVVRSLLIDEEKGVFVLLLSSQLSLHTEKEREEVPGADVSQSRRHDVRARAESSIRYDGQSRTYAPGAPKIGEQTRELLRELGYSDSTIEEIVASSVAQ
jgi:hypothetical protein